MAIDLASEIIAPLSNGKQIIEAAREEAARLLSDANNRCAEIFSEAQRKGLEAGQLAISTLLAECASLRARVISDAQHDIVDIIEFVATQVVGETLRSHPTSLVSRVERAIATLHNKSAIKLFVNPEVSATVQEQLGNINACVTLLTDCTLGINDARLEAEGVTVTSSPSRHLRALILALRGEDQITDRRT